MDEIRQQLLKRKLGWILNWRAPELKETVGPYDPQVFLDYETKRKAAADKCHEALLKFTDDEIVLLASADTPRTTDALRWWRSFQSEEISALERLRPPWYAGGFGHPNYEADFDYWCKMPSLTIKEAVCLSLGFGPDHLPSFRLEKDDQKNFDRLWPCARFLIRRIELFERQFDPYGYGDRVQPGPFLDWADQVDLTVHSEFTRLLARYHLPPRKNPRDDGAGTEPDRRKQDGREVTSVATLITALAIDAYGYRPEHARSPFPREITDVAAKFGLSISEDTVRKYLKIGASGLPPNWNTE